MFLYLQVIWTKSIKIPLIISCMVVVTSTTWSTEKSSQDIDSEITAKFLKDAGKAHDKYNYLKTLKLAEMAINIQPSNMKAHWMKGLALLGLKKFEDTVKEFQIVAEAQPDNKKINNTIEKVKTFIKNDTILKEAHIAYKAKNFSHVFYLLEPLAEIGHPGAMYILAVMFSSAQGTTQDKLKAKELFTSACDGGNMDACQSLGYMHITGKYIKQDKSKAKKLFEKACDNNNASGCYNLGYMYDKGYGANTNLNKAKKLYKKACDNGHTESCNNLKKMPTKIADTQEEKRELENLRNSTQNKKIAPIKKIPKTSNTKLAQIPPSVNIPQDLIPPIHAPNTPKGLGVETPSIDSWPHQELALKSVDEILKLFNYEKLARHKNKKYKWYYKDYTKGNHVFEKYNDQEEDRTELEIGFSKDKVTSVTYRDDDRNKIKLYFNKDSSQIISVRYYSKNNNGNGPVYKYFDDKTIKYILEHKATKKDDATMNHGKHIWLDKNGFRTSESYYKEGKFSGTWKEYKNGKLTSMTHYIDNSKDWLEIVYRDGLLEKIVFHEISLPSIFYIYYKKGKFESMRKSIH